MDKFCLTVILILVLKKKMGESEMLSYGFILTSLIIVLIPGTGVIYTISTGITGSKKDCIAAAIGCTAGIVPHIIASILGLSAILHTSALLFQVIKMAGIAYLIFLGFGMIKNNGGLKINGENKEGNKLKIISKGILINLLNPKLTLFFFLFLPQFIQSKENSYFYQMIILSTVFMGLTLIVFILYGLLANYFKIIINTSANITKRIQQLFGIVFIGLAAKLAFIDN